MKCRFVNTALVAIMLTISSLAQAGLLIDTDRDSYIDTTTGMEWMDFGINNGQSYDYVISQLDVGGTYEGWVLPSAMQVYGMWSSAFLGLGSSSEYPDLWGVGQFLVSDHDELNSKIPDVASVMGFNIHSISPFMDTYISTGMFAGTQGMAYVAVKHGIEGDGDDATFVSDASLYDRGHNEGEMNLEREEWSTMLVRPPPSNEVPEPATMAIFALGMIGLASRRFKKQS